MRELVLLFLKLGSIGFGGPAAHIALLREETVERRGWLDDGRFMDLVGATNLIPGPNSTEMAIHIGYLRGGAIGMILAGAAFIAPAFCITTAFAWMYVEYGDTPTLGPALAGVKPVVLAIIAIALWKLGKTALKTPPLWGLAAAALAAPLAGANEIAVLLTGGALGAFAARGGWRPGANLFALGLPAAVPWLAVFAATAPAASVSLWKLGWFFLKVGSVLYGGGYVLFAFIEGGLVDQYGWLTRAQLIDAIAAGQFTPGPILTAATFIGYIAAGFPGAVVATLGIFLPSFFFVWLLQRHMAALRSSPAATAFLDAVNACAVGLMASVTLVLGAASMVSWHAWLIAALALAVRAQVNVNPAWLVLAGGLLGWLLG